MADTTFATAFAKPAIVGVIHLMRDGGLVAFCGQDTSGKRWQHYGGRTRQDIARIIARANVCRRCARRLSTIPDWR